MRRRRSAGAHRDALPPGPLVVGLESGGDHLSVALLRVGLTAGEPPSAWLLVEEVTSHRGHQHADTLLGVLDAALSRQGLRPSEIDAIAVGRGPGGFTGVRVGMATGLGAALGLGVPVLPVDSLAALALQAAGLGRTWALPLIDARKGEVYGALYAVEANAAPREVMPAAVGPVGGILARARALASGEPLVALGSGALVAGLGGDVPARAHVPSAYSVAWLGARSWDAAGRPAAGAPLDPAYVRKSEAELAEERRQAS